MFQITAALQSDGQCQQTGDCRTEETVVWSAVSECSSSAAATHQIREQWCHSTGDQTHGAQVWPGGETESDRWDILWWFLNNLSYSEFGQYVAECMPKYVQKVQLTAGDELELLIAPSGLVPVMSFLKNHHNAQFGSLVDIAGVDIPTREYRYE